MPNRARRILIVGAAGPSMTATAERLTRHRWQCQSVEGLREAKRALDANEFEIVLAAELVSDGRGYELTAEIVGKSLSLLVGVKISDGFLWLPAVERGVKTLGSRAVNPVMLESAVEELLQLPSTATVGEFPDHVSAPRAHPGPKHAFPPRRKTAGVP